MSLGHREVHNKGIWRKTQHTQATKAELRKEIWAKTEVGSIIKRDRMQVWESKYSLLYA